MAVLSPRDEAAVDELYLQLIPDAIAAYNLYILARTPVPWNTEMRYWLMLGNPDTTLSTVERAYVEELYFSLQPGATEEFREYMLNHTPYLWQEDMVERIGAMPINAQGITSITSSTSLVIPRVSARVGDLLVLSCAADNAGAAGAPSLSATVPAVAGNSWTLRGALINRTVGAPNDGVTLGIWTCAVTTAFTGQPITLNFSQPTVAKAANLWLFENAPTVLASSGVGATGPGDPATIVIPAVPAGATVLAFIAAESAARPGPDSDTVNGSWSRRQVLVADNSGNLPSVTLASQYKVVTATGDQSYTSGVGTTRDYAMNWLTLRPA